MCSNYKVQLLAPKSQRGAVLIVGLVMVLLMTIVGLSAVRSSGLQEAMSGNMRDRNIAFQACESALRLGETVVTPPNPLPGFNNTPGTGLFGDLNSTPSGSIINYTPAQWIANAMITALNISNVDSQPRYMVEKIDAPVSQCAAAEGSGIGIGTGQQTGTCLPFRVTARGVGITPDTDVVCQSNYIRMQP